MNTIDSVVLILLLHSYLFVYVFVPSFSLTDGNEVWSSSSFSSRIYVFIYSFLLSLSQTATKCGRRPPSPLVFICLFIRSFFLSLRRQRSVVLVLLLHSYLFVYLFVPSFSLSLRRQRGQGFHRPAQPRQHPAGSARGLRDPQLLQPDPVRH